MASVWCRRRYRYFRTPALHISCYPQLRRAGGHCADRRHYGAGCDCQGIRRMVPVFTYEPWHACESSRRSHAMRTGTVCHNQPFLYFNLYSIRCDMVSEKRRSVRIIIKPSKTANERAFAQKLNTSLNKRVLTLLQCRLRIRLLQPRVIMCLHLRPEPVFYRQNYPNRKTHKSPVRKILNTM